MSRRSDQLAAISKDEIDHLMMTGRRRYGRPENRGFVTITTPIDRPNNHPDPEVPYRSGAARCVDASGAGKTARRTVLGERSRRSLELEREHDGKDPARPDEGPPDLVDVPHLLRPGLAVVGARDSLLFLRTGLALGAHDRLLATDESMLGARRDIRTRGGRTGGTPTSIGWKPKTPIGIGQKPEAYPENAPKPRRDNRRPNAGGPIDPGAPRSPGDR